MSLFSALLVPGGASQGVQLQLLEREISATELTAWFLRGQKSEEFLHVFTVRLYLSISEVGA